MITEDFVPFSLAKALRDKGLDCKFVFYYRDDDEKKVVHHANVLQPLVYGENVDNEVINAATLQTACKFLREIHGIDIIPFHEKLPNDCYWCRIEKYLYTMFQQEPIFKSFKDAVVNAIEYCLSNLI